MMTGIVPEKRIDFKDLERHIFDFCCSIGREMTKNILEAYDDEISGGRNKSKYRDKGKRKTSIKTIYGEVAYERRVYKTQLESGENAYVYLLDEVIGMDTIGLISTNLAEVIINAASETPFRKAAQMVNNASGEQISHTGVWNLTQKLGERISEEEDHHVRLMEAGQATGDRAIGLLFEEMDGVWLHMQDANHKKAPKKEMKVATIYEGWSSEKEAEGRSTLVGKRTLAGMETADEFHRKREAGIEQIYDVCVIGQRVLNGDGGSWINEPYDGSTIFQLDPYHVQAAILKGITDDEARNEARGLLREHRIDDLLEHIQTYANSVASDDPGDKRSRKADELYAYLNNNREGLLPWQVQMGEVPAPPEGCFYKNMGVQENQNCSVITLRMKNRRMRWSVPGANNMGKVLYRKANGELSDTISRYTDGSIFKPVIKEFISTLSAARSPKKDGKGSPYPDRITCHMPLLDAARTAGRKALTDYLEGVL